MVEQLPLVVCEVIPLIVDELYLAQGFGVDVHSTCNVVTASLPELLQSGNRYNTNHQVWNKLYT